MLRKASLTLLLACLNLSCVHGGPKLTACLVNAKKQQCDCYDERTQKAFTLTLDQCDKYVALPPKDAETLINYCSAKKP